MLAIKKLEAGYGEIKVLNKVDMNIQPGEIVVLIGPNGAGKSTVLRSIFNICDVASGSIFYKNENITRLPTHTLIELGISYVPQGRQVFSSLTVKENLEMGAYLTPDKSIVGKRIEEVLKHFPELKPKLNDLAYTLSGGQQQMLAIGRALMQDPQLLLLDEPSLGLSPKMTSHIFQKVFEINKEGTAVLIVEQNAKRAVKIADRIYVLEEGKVAMHGDRKILKDARIKHIYLGGHGH